MRVRATLHLLAAFPLAGRTIERDELRFLVGPWRWFISVYEYDEDADEVRVLAIVDGRSQSWASRRA